MLARAGGSEQMREEEEERRWRVATQDQSQDREQSHRQGFPERLKLFRPLSWWRAARDRWVRLLSCRRDLLSTS